MKPLACFLVLSLLLCLGLNTGISQASSHVWGTPKIISSMMIGVHLDEEVHVANVRYGSKNHNLLFVLDFTIRDIIISHVPSSLSGIAFVGSHPSLWSSSFSSAEGGSDLIQLGDSQHRVPVKFDATASALRGCPICNGVMGLGAASPLWLLWPRVTFTAGTIVLKESRGPVSNDKLLPRIACRLADNNLCTSAAQVFGKTYDIQFSFSSPYTFVPVEVFNAYVEDRNIDETSISDWPDFVLRFNNSEAPADNRHPILRIAPQSLLGACHVNEVKTLLMRINPNPLVTDTILLGRSVWRSLMMRRFFDSGKAVIVSYDSIKRYSFWVMVFGLIMVLVGCRWWKTQDALFYETPGYFPNRKTQTGKWRSPYVNIDNNPRAKVSIDKIEQARFPAEWTVYPDRMLIELLSIPVAVTSLYLNGLREAASINLMIYVFLNVFVYVSIAWIILEWILRASGEAGLMGVLEIRSPTSLTPFFRIYRIGLIRQASVSFLLVIIMVMLSTFTRADTLGTFMIMISSLLLLMLIYYHTSTAVLHVLRYRYKLMLASTKTLYSTGTGPALEHIKLSDASQRNLNDSPVMWYLWVIYCVVLSLTVSVILSIGVFFPFLQTRVTWSITGLFLLWIGIINIGGAALMYKFASFHVDGMDRHIAHHQALLAKIAKKQKI